VPLLFFFAIAVDVPRRALGRDNASFFARKRPAAPACILQNFGVFKNPHFSVFFGSGWPFFKSVYTGVNELGRGWVRRKRARVSTRANQPSSATARPLEDSRPGQKHPALKCTTDNRRQNHKRQTAHCCDTHRPRRPSRRGTPGSPGGWNTRSRSSSPSPALRWRSACVRA